MIRESVTTMLTLYGSKIAGALAYDLASTRLPAEANWIDALDPNEGEIAFLERALGTRIPGLADLEEIESSSRLAIEGDVLTMSFPAALRDGTGFPQATPIGLVLTKDWLLTIRYARLSSFENLSRRLAGNGDLAEGGLGATVTILEVVIDHIADVLERIGGDLDGISRRSFAGDMASPRTGQPRRTNEAMRAMLQTVGRSGDFISKTSESLLCLNRMVPFILAHAETYVTAAYRARLNVIASDAKSLSDHEEHLTGKTQFLLDTLLGVANIEQNNVFRVLTVVSVVGIPPTFFASMWGMNFKSMPELDWPHGYAMGLSVIFISAVAPAIWFKARGWW